MLVGLSAPCLSQRFVCGYHAAAAGDGTLRKLLTVHGYSMPHA